MNMIHATVLGATALLVATSVSALAQSPQVPTAGEVVQAPGLPSAPQQSERQTRPLFTIGGGEGRVWAPVEAPYDANINRPLAEVPLWENPN